VFLDFVRYVRFEQDPKVAGQAGEGRTPSYVAFVLRRGRPVRRVELGPAQPIETALDGWRRDIAGDRTGPAADRLRRLVWDPLAGHLPADTTTVLLAPDGALHRLPWAALPGNRRGTVLLQDHALAVVPHGPFLLDRLTAPRADPGPGLLVAVGGVHYDREPEPAGARPGEALVARPAERGGPGRSWQYLPGTLREVDQVIALAGDRPVCGRRGSAAGTGQVLADLPRARWAHLATHGFFADARVRSALQLDERLFASPGGRVRAAPGARNPLVLSGLVLSGANRPPPTDAKDPARDDGGILTAEAIAGLPLQGLELAVLSACETGLGEVAGGEGVFGLQRAFHLAGTHTVVASLWKVDDRATQALMAEFYRNLWGKKLGKLEALRQAQLTVMRHYDPRHGQLRDAGTPVPLDAEGLARAREGVGAQEHLLAPALWAAWVVSGDPGDLSRAGPAPGTPTEAVAPADAAGSVRGPASGVWRLSLGGLGGLVLVGGLVLWHRCRRAS
jgi:CHAT domain-containing protein